MIYPWQKEQWQKLHYAKNNARIPHALLLSGMQGLGKTQFAEMFAASLLCKKLVGDYACTTCHDCRLMKGRTHPNVLWIEPEKEGQAIKVDQVREISLFVQQSSLQGEHRIVLINPANKMNLNAANALLKTLEEPAKGALLILISDQSVQLPATILSRCQRISFTKPEQDEAFSWLQNALPKQSQKDILFLLQLAQGAPLAAMQLQDETWQENRKQTLNAFASLLQKNANPIQYAADLQDLASLTFLDFALGWIVDIMRLQLQDDVIVNQDYADTLTKFAETLSLANMRALLDQVQKIRAQISMGMNLNKQLLMEDVLLRFFQLILQK